MLLISGLLVLALILLGLAASGAILYHFLTFGVAGDRSKKLAAVFAMGTALWLVLIAGSFLAVPWNNLTQGISFPKIPSMPITPSMTTP